MCVCMCVCVCVGGGGGRGLAKLRAYKPGRPIFVRREPFFFAFKVFSFCTFYAKSGHFVCTFDVCENKTYTAL